MDVFGHNLGVSYKGRGSYTTVAGTICTLIVSIFILLNLVTLSTEYANGSYTEETTRSYFNRRLSDTFVLAENGIEIILIENPLKNSVNEKYGKWKVFQTKPYEDGYNPRTSNVLSDQYK